MDKDSTRVGSSVAESAALTFAPAPEVLHVIEIRRCEVRKNQPPPLNEICIQSHWTGSVFSEDEAEAAYKAANDVIEHHCRAAMEKSKVTHAS